MQLTGAFWDVEAIAAGSLGQVGDLEATAARHTAILVAIENGDADLLRQAIVDHYVPVRERMSTWRLSSAPQHP